MNIHLTQGVTSPKKGFRYPGVTPFATGQAHIFFGRQQDTDELYRLIRREPLVVLFGKSGLGKSSLLNAGIIPRCQSEGEYNPFVIRFGAWTDSVVITPLTIVKVTLAGDDKAATFLDKLLPSDTSLWYHAKNRQINALKGQGGGRPLLIFDQFEELFSYPEEQVSAFQEEISELLNTGIPLRFRRMAEGSETITEEEEVSLEAPLDARILFAIRSDRLHLLDNLKDHLPNVMRHCKELKALTPKDAMDAIMLPAQAEGDFITGTFEYSSAALDKMLAYLGDEKDKENRVEGILLQMLCEYYERKMVTEGCLLLDLPHIGDPERVIKRYYEERIEELSEEQRMPARILIEDGLVSEGEAMRLTLHETFIFQKFGVTRTLLELLVNYRLLRSEPFLRGGYTYELSHDRLVPPVLNARSLRREEEAKLEVKRQLQELEKTKKRLRIVWGLLTAAVLALLAAGYFGYKAEQQKKTTNEATIKAKQSLIEAYQSEIRRYKGEKFASERNKQSFINYNAENDVIELEDHKIDSLTKGIKKLEDKIKQLNQ